MKKWMMIFGFLAMSAQAADKFEPLLIEEVVDTTSFKQDMQTMLKYVPKLNTSFAMKTLYEIDTASALRMQYKSYSKPEFNKVSQTLGRLQASLALSKYSVDRFNAALDRAKGGLDQECLTEIVKSLVALNAAKVALQQSKDLIPQSIDECKALLLNPAVLKGDGMMGYMDVPKNTAQLKDLLMGFTDVAKETPETLKGIGLSMARLVK